MKKILLAAFLGLVLGSASAQTLTTQIPSLVKTSFDTQYPHAKKINWTAGQNGYQVSFETRHKKCFVMYDENGKSVGQIVEIYKVNLPRGIRKKLDHNYNGFIVETASKIDTPNGSFYEASIARSEESYKLDFTPQGDVIMIQSIDGF